MSEVDLFIVNFFFFFFFLDNIDLGGWVNYNIGSYLVCDFVGFSYNSEYSSYVFLMLMVCSYISVVYSYHYFSDGKFAWLLSFIMICFSLVMLILVSTSSFLVSLVLWEYLGLVSYILICFYDTNDSLRAGFITLVTSRFGDVCLFILVALFYCGGYANSVLFSFIVFLVVSTKSASFPFVSWLLEAMRAPTPVSSLVHSSTLVASGVWMIGGYYYVIGVDYGGSLICFLQFCSVLTIIVSSVSALFYVDVKRLIALSTSSNISWVFLILSVGDYILAFVQLLVHAISKCLLFTFVGDYIISSFGGQNKNQVDTNIYGNIFSLIYMFILLLGLSGFPFMGLYFSKHVFLSSVVSMSYFSIIFLLFVIVGLMLSSAYSVRLFIIFFGGLTFGCYTTRMCFYIVLIVPMIGTFLGYHLSFSLFNYFSGFMSLLSLFILFIMFIGVLLGVYIGYWCSEYSKSWIGYLCGIDYLVYMYNCFMSIFWDYVFLGIFRWEVGLFDYICYLVNSFSVSYMFEVSCLVFGTFIVVLYLFF
uniref:NADH:ubiquinone reductase (H(+)-translocating) n=1 Tax=Schistosoma mekongi TaxID=38744 RepID=Q9B8V3_SCHME|nr:NADH dehydrogenase subunit 5 [Schistosoma mekongi]AAG12178.2 NADH dehydrogenase subunit 5 [Schistosoma mekongi]